jgi:hypothetical protein
VIVLSLLMIAARPPFVTDQSLLFAARSLLDLLDAVWVLRVSNPLLVLLLLPSLIVTSRPPPSTSDTFLEACRPLI